MVEASGEYLTVLAPVALVSERIVLTPVPKDEYLAALYRKAICAPLPCDEVVLSHAASCGVEDITTAVALSRLNSRLAVP